MIEYAWHYTTGECFIKIAESGVLELATAFLPEGEKPVLWFSINQKWEPTSGKGLIKNGGHRALKTMQENYEHGRGLARFGYPPDGLIPWVKLPIRSETKRGLEKAGRLCGANPFHWMGALLPIDITDTVIEIMNNHGVWERIQTPWELEKAA
jgi:hypothetical protein